MLQLGKGMHCMLPDQSLPAEHAYVKQHDLCSKHQRNSDVSNIITTASTPLEVRARRKELGVIPSMKRVDTCAAEFEAATPYMYSSYDGNCECEPTSERKVSQLQPCCDLAALREICRSESGAQQHHCDDGPSF